MPTLSHRLQVLVDDARLQMLERESQRTGRSVADLVRGAVDVVYGPDSSKQRAAVDVLLSEEPMAVEDWATMKRTMLDELSDSAR